STRADSARSNARRSNTVTLPAAGATSPCMADAASAAIAADTGALVSIAALMVRDHHQQRLFRQVRGSRLFPGVQQPRPVRQRTIATLRPGQQFAPALPVEHLAQQLRIGQEAR